MKHNPKRMTQERNEQALDLSETRRKYLKKLHQLQDPKNALKLKAEKKAKEASESEEEVLGLSMDEDSSSEEE